MRWNSTITTPTPQENTNIANDSKNAVILADLTEQWLKGWRGAKTQKVP